MFVCVSVCLYVRERERERTRKRDRGRDIREGLIDARWSGTETGTIEAKQMVRGQGTYRGEGGGQE